MQPSLDLVNKTFGNYSIRGIKFQPTYWQAAAIVFLIFLLLFTIARVRNLYVNWNLGRSALSMFFWGFLLALIIEGFLIIGGKTLFTEILGWENAPKPISTALDLGRDKLVDVLGVREEIPQSKASENPTYQSVVGDYHNLGEEDKEMVKSFLCEP